MSCQLAERWFQCSFKLVWPVPNELKLSVLKYTERREKMECRALNPHSCRPVVQKSRLKLRKLRRLVSNTAQPNHFNHFTEHKHLLQQMGCWQGLQSQLRAASGKGAGQRSQTNAGRDLSDGCSSPDGHEGYTREDNELSLTSIEERTFGEPRTADDDRTS